MKPEAPEFKSATDGLTEEQVERAKKRTAHGDLLYGKIVGLTSADWLHYSEARKELTSSERATFDLEFIKARAVAGVRPAVDLALAAMRTKLMQRLGTPTWRAR